MDIFIIMGPPYSGKGTHCKFIKEDLGLVHISTGSRCRLEKEKGTEIGKMIALYEEKGDLVPDVVMKELFDQILDENLNVSGIILDGYPRTVAQVKTMLELVSAKNLTIKKVFNIEVPKEELLNRAQERARTSDRKDDQDPKTHIKRIDVFNTSSLPAIAYMKEVLDVSSFDGSGSIDQTRSSIREVTSTIKTV